MFRRVLLPFGVSVVAIVSLMLAWSSITANDGIGSIMPAVYLFTLWVSPFVAVGLVLLLPVQVIIRRAKLPPPIARSTFVFAGGILGTVLILPLAEHLTFELLIGTGAGALSAGIWSSLNRDRVEDGTRSRR